MAIKPITNGEVHLRPSILAKRAELIERLAAAEDVLIERRQEALAAQKARTQAIQDAARAEDRYDRQVMIVREIVRKLAQFASEPPLSRDSELPSSDEPQVTP